MPERDRRRLVELLEKHDVLLIEDDVYGDLRFDGERPVPVQFLGSNARVMTVGSFSKSVAPGYRIGWLAAGESIDEVARRKRAFSCSSGLLQQLTLAEFIATGDYARHVKALRPVLKRNADRMSALIAEHFPAETRVSQPHGGAVLWLELPRQVNAEVLLDRSIEAGISIVPGAISSPCGCYENFIRLSFGHPWTERTNEAVRWLGAEVVRMAG